MPFTNAHYWNFYLRILFPEHMSLILAANKHPKIQDIGNCSCTTLSALFLRKALLNFSHIRKHIQFPPISFQHLICELNICSWFCQQTNTFSNLTLKPIFAETLPKRTQFKLTRNELSLFAQISSKFPNVIFHFRTLSPKYYFFYIISLHYQLILSPKVRKTAHFNLYLQTIFLQQVYWQAMTCGSCRSYDLCLDNYRKGETVVLLFNKPTFAIKIHQI